MIAKPKAPTKSEAAEAMQQLDERASAMTPAEKRRAVSILNARGKSLKNKYLWLHRIIFLCALPIYIFQAWTSNFVPAIALLPIQLAAYLLEESSEKEQEQMQPFLVVYDDEYGVEDELAARQTELGRAALRLQQYSPSEPVSRWIRDYTAIRSAIIVGKIKTYTCIAVLLVVYLVVLISSNELAYMLIDRYPSIATSQNLSHFNLSNVIVIISSAIFTCIIACGVWLFRLHAKRVSNPPQPSADVLREAASPFDGIAREYRRTRSMAR